MALFRRLWFLSFATILNAILICTAAFPYQQYEFPACGNQSACPSTLSNEFNGNVSCSMNATRFQLSDPPYKNYFYSDCHSSCHVVVTSPLAESDTAFVKPRLLVAWPSGDSGAVMFFKADNDSNGSLGIKLLQSMPNGEFIDPIYSPGDSIAAHPQVGVSSLVKFNTSAVLTSSILGSIRTIRDSVDSQTLPSTSGKGFYQDHRESVALDGGANINRTWLDNVTMTIVSFTPMQDTQPVKLQDDGFHLAAGTYRFNASFNYPQLEQLSPSQDLKPGAQQLINEYPDQTASLSFLSYSTKILAGTWRFLTYFGRDSMITLLLMQSVLSEGKGGAIEAIISAVLERIDRHNGTACHEEIIGDYATYLNLLQNISSTAPQCDYKMIDTDYYVPIVVKNYFLDTATGRDRASSFMNMTASFLPDNSGISYSTLFLATAEKIMNTSAPFAQPGGQTKDNLIHLQPGQEVGDWRDSTEGLGGGSIPYDVNTALVPASLRALSALIDAGYFPSHPEWNQTAANYAKVWEDETLRFFEIVVPQSTAISLVESYANYTSFPGPSNTTQITSNVTFYGLALDGDYNQSIVRVMNTDDMFRLFFLNTTEQSQLSSFINQTADHILQPFPVGLSSSVGLFVSNPAYGGNNSYYASTWNRLAYHGTVVWSFTLAMMADGLARQLERCGSSAVPDFCKDQVIHTKVKSAYNHLWDLIDANKAELSSEVWSWTYNSGFQVEPLGVLTSTESDIRQLWSLTFLALRRLDF